MKDNIKLTIELVPSKSWYTNVRSNVTQQEWDTLRKACYRKANSVCEICGDTSKNQGKQYDLECHEIWDYNDKNKVQKLVGLIGLCNHCHTVKHPGLAGMQGRGQIVINQLMKVNGMTESEASDYITDSFATWEARSEYDWKLDITYLDEYKKEIVNEEQNLKNKMDGAIAKYRESRKLAEPTIDDKLKDVHTQYKLAKAKELYKKNIKENHINEATKKVGDYILPKKQINPLPSKVKVNENKLTDDEIVRVLDVYFSVDKTAEILKSDYDMIIQLKGKTAFKGKSSEAKLRKTLLENGFVNTWGRKYVRQK